MAPNFRLVFLNENCYIFIQISVIFVTEGQLTINHHQFRYGLMLNPCQAIIWAKDGLDYCHRSCVTQPPWVNTLRPRQDGRHFADNTFNRIFVNENVRIWIKFSMKFVPKGPINNIPALVQIRAWRRTGDKPLSEPMMTQFNDAYMRHSASMS